MRPQTSGRDVRRHATTPDLIADSLRDSIHLGELPGGSLLQQEEFARRFQVSRIPVREALRRLEAEGLVVFFPNRGARVVELGEEQVREIYSLRNLLEGDLLERAIPLLGEEDFLRAESLHEGLAKVTDTVRLNSLNRSFHSVFYGAPDRPRQVEMIERLRGMVERYENVRHSFLADMPNFQEDHRRILEACRSRNISAARSALRLHLEHAERLALAALNRTERS
jgi:DNA-binding GntR family transcriptional regulator